jgi:hypothetical protein
MTRSIVKNGGRRRKGPAPFMGRVKALTMSRDCVKDELVEKVGSVRAYVICRAWFDLLFWNQLLSRDNFRCQISGHLDFNPVRLRELGPGQVFHAIYATRIIPFDPNPLCVSKSET